MDISRLVEAGGVPLAVFDMSRLQFRVARDGSAVTVRTPDGEPLGSAALPPSVVSDGTIDQGSFAFRDAVYAALQDALEHGRVLRDVPESGLMACHVALLNGTTGELEVGAGLDGRVFDVAGTILDGGQLAVLDDQDGTLVAPSGERLQQAATQPRDEVIQRLGG